MIKIKTLVSCLLLIPALAAAGTMHNYSVAITNKNFHRLTNMELTPYSANDVCNWKMEAGHVEFNQTIHGQLSIEDGSACMIKWTTEGNLDGGIDLFMQAVAIGDVTSDKLCVECKVEITQNEINIVQLSVTN